MGGVGVFMHACPYDCVRAWEGPTGASGRWMVCV